MSNKKLEVKEPWYKLERFKDLIKQIENGHPNAEYIFKIVSDKANHNLEIGSQVALRRYSKNQDSGDGKYRLLHTMGSYVYFMDVHPVVKDINHYENIMKGYKKEHLSIIQKMNKVKSQIEFLKTRKEGEPFNFVEFKKDFVKRIIETKKGNEIVEELSNFDIIFFEELKKHNVTNSDLKNAMGNELAPVTIETRNVTETTPFNINW